ncbi:MAG TPA: biopolymer transporter ExbD [Terriglobales bacterium]|nr:biopolymer transporter ExbD [Terriglobales bacterium]
MTHGRCLSIKMLSRRPKSKLLAGIDVTAFASVMLVLVAMFILPASVVTHPWNGVDLAKVSHATRMPHARREDAMIVSVQRDGKVYFGSDLVSPGQLPALIRQQISRGSEKKLYVRADARARYSSVKVVLDEVPSSGVENIAFLVAQRAPSPPR